MGSALYPLDTKVSSNVPSDPDGNSTGLIALELGTDGNSVLCGPVTRTFAAGVAAAGNSQGTATALTTHISEVTGSDGTKGVVLPASVAGLEIAVINTVAGSALKVYPPSGSQIDALGANAALSLAGAKSVILRCTTSTQWYSMVGA